MLLTAKSLNESWLLADETRQRGARRVFYCSAVLFAHAIESGTVTPGRDGVLVYYSPANNVRVIVDPATGNIITVGYGGATK